LPCKEFFTYLFKPELSIQLRLLKTPKEANAGRLI